MGKREKIKDNYSVVVHLFRKEELYKKKGNKEIITFC